MVASQAAAHAAPAESATSGPLLRITRHRWPAAFCAVFLCLALALALMQAPTDPDLGWHLRTGQLILTMHAVPAADVFSFTKLGAAWVDQEWLWQVMVAGLMHMAGQAGLVAVKVVVPTGVIALVYLLLRTRGLPPRTATIGAAGSTLLLGAYSEVRPAMVGPLFSAAFLLLMEQHRRSRDWRCLAALVPLELVWANCHGSYLLGPFLCAVYAVAECWEARAFGTWRRWAILLASLLAVSLINPRGVGLLQFALTAAHLPFNRQFVAEWASPELDKWPGLGLAAMLVLSLGLAAQFRDWGAKRRQFLLLLCCTSLALFSHQFVPLYAVAAVPVLAELAYGLAGRPEEEQYLPRGIASVMLLALMLIGVAGPARQLAPANYQAAIDHAYPTEAVTFIQRQGLSGPVFNEYDWGGYLIQALPRLPVFVDGRSEVYGDGFLRTWMAVETATEPAGPLFSEYHINLVLIKPHSALANELRQNQNWREAYRDGVASVFVRMPQP